MSKEQNNQEKAEGIVDRFLASDLVANVKLGAYTVKDLLLIFVPFAVAIYILHTQSDRIVLAVGVAIALVGLGNTVKLAFSYEKLSNAKKRR